MPNATLVQATAHGTTSVTFGAGPTQNNVLVAFGFNSTTTIPTVDVAWTSFATGASGTSAGLGRAVAAAWKVAGAAEATTQTPFSAGVAETWVQEWNTGNPATTVDTLNGGTTLTTFSAPAATSSQVTVTRTPTASQDSLIICFWCNRKTGTGAYYSAETLTGPLTMTEDDDWGSNTALGVGAIAHLEVASTTGSYAGTATAADALNGNVNAIVVLNTAAASAPAQTPYQPWYQRAPILAM